VIDILVDAGFPVKVCCRNLGVSSPGYYRYQKRALAPTKMRREWLTGLIREVHLQSRGTYGYRRVHAELTKGMGLVVSDRLVWFLMHDAGIRGLPNLTGKKPTRGIPTADDLVNRRFHRDRPNELWVTDITEHPTREGKVFCCCVLDAFSRRIIGWSIDSVQNSNLVVNALDMAIKNRRPKPGGVVHADHGTQGEFNRLSQHPITMEVLDGSPTTSCGSSSAQENEIARSSAAAARSGATVLDRDRQRLGARRGGGSGRCFPTGRATPFP
jgi:transposase InsO family protein